MESAISRLIEDFETGKLTRRQLVARLAGLAAIGAAMSEPAAAETAPATFQALGLNHIALSATDVERSRDFYVQHLGLQVTSERLPYNCFLSCGPDFVALFRADRGALHHYCYSIPDYDQQDAAERLRAVGLEPSLQGNRIYFPDPDGLTVQLASPTG